MFDHYPAGGRSSDPAVVRHRRRARIAPLAVGAAAVVASAVAGCGGGSSTSSQPTTSPPTSPPTTSPPSSPTTAPPTSATPTGGAGGAPGGTIKTATVGQLGQIVVDGQSRTVYLFQKDTGTTSSCSGSCAAVWPPVTTSGKPQAGSGADAAKLGTTKRSDGTTEVTYSGHPLYYYAPDGTASGSAKGQGLNQFGAKWYVLSPSGSAVTKQPSGGGGGGY
ncbi:COG4315 family predicted lipoprotein [Actinomadura verrucosospora]